MNRTHIIMTAGIRRNMRSKSLVLSYIALLVLLSAAVVLLFGVLFFAPEAASEAPDDARLSDILTVVMYLCCLIGIGMMQNIFSFMPLTRAKSRGIIEALLAGPVTPRELWIGKSLAVWLPGLVAGEFLAVLVFCGFNVVFIIPAGEFLFSPWMFISVFAVLPLLYLGLSLLVHLAGLSGKTASGNVIAQVFFPAFGALMTNLVMHKVVDADGWSFTLLNLGIAAVLFFIVYLSRSFLTSERIVLSEAEAGS